MPQALKQPTIYRHARVGDIDIHYDFVDYTEPWSTTPAPTFLMYSGYCRSLEFWRGWVPPLSGSYRILRMDPRGYGDTTKPAPGDTLRIDQVAGDALGMMDHLGVDKVHWVGDSTGGAVGMMTALLAPERVSSITLCNTTAKMAPVTVDTYALGEKDQAAAIERYGVGEWCRRTLKYRMDITKVPPEVGEWVADDMDRVPRHVAIAVFRLFSTVDLWPRLAEIKAPTLLIVGNTCPDGRRDQMTEMARTMQDAEIMYLDGFDYGIHFLAPQACVAAVRAFLGKRGM
jgi:3-oxoadipate enol-lactonase